MVTPAANIGAPYAVPPQVSLGAAPVQMQMPPPAYGGDPSQMYQGQPPQYQQWGPPSQNFAMQPQVYGTPPQSYGAPNYATPPGVDGTQGYQPQGMSSGVAPQESQQAQSGYSAQGAPGPDPGMMQSPPRMSAYEQQEAAIREAQMSEQLDEVRQQKEMDEGFRHGVLAELDDNSKSSGSSGGFNGDQTKLKSGVAKTKSALKTGMRWCAPTASYIGTFFIFRGMTGGF